MNYLLNFSCEKCSYREVCTVVNPQECIVPCCTTLNHTNISILDSNRLMSKINMPVGIEYGKLQYAVRGTVKAIKIYKNQIDFKINVEVEYDGYSVEYDFYRYLELLKESPKYESIVKKES